MAEDKKPPEVPTARGGRSTKIVRVDLVNDTKAQQTIDSGDEMHTRISLEPGETKRSVEVAEWVAQELRKRSRGNPHQSHQLRVYEAGKAPAPKSDSSDEDGEDDAD